MTEPQPARRYQTLDYGHTIDIIEWDDGGATIVCLDCGAQAAGATPAHAIAHIHTHIATDRLPSP
jgi:hypothetical protein